MSDNQNYPLEHPHDHEPGSRIDYYQVASEAFGHIKALEIYSRNTALDEAFREVLKLRVSQMNGCPYCIDMHEKAAKKLEAPKEQLVDLLSWKTSDAFSEEEKIALEIAEHVTHIGEKGLDDDLYTRARRFFDEREYVDLILVVNQVNMWNRITIAMGVTVK